MTTTTLPAAAAEVADSAKATVDDTAVDILRHQINALDAAIARLVAERAQLSRQVQTARIKAGGSRIELARERDIMTHYKTELGTHGADFGEAVLRLCRGVD